MNPYINSTSAIGLDVDTSRIVTVHRQEKDVVCQT
jgi:hypothetical protein